MGKFLEDLGDAGGLRLFRVEGKYDVYTKLGGIRHRMLKYLDENNVRVFVTREICAAIGLKSDVVSCQVNLLRQRGAVCTSKFGITLSPTANREKLHWIRGYEFEIESYLLNHVIDSEERLILLKLLDGEEAFSKYRLRVEYDVFDYRFLEAFLKFGFLKYKSVEVETAGGKKEKLGIIYSERCKKLEEFIEREKDWFVSQKGRAPREGRAFEQEIFEFIRLGIKYNSIFFKPVLHKNRFFFKYPSGRKSEVDAVIYSIPVVYHPVRKKFVELAYAYTGGIKTLVGCKKFARGWEAQNLHTAMDKAFSNPSIFVFAERIGKSLIESLELLGGMLCTGKFLKMVRECTEEWKRWEAVGVQPELAYEAYIEGESDEAKS